MQDFEPFPGMKDVDPSDTPDVPAVVNHPFGGPLPVETADTPQLGAPPIEAPKMTSVKSQQIQFQFPHKDIQYRATVSFTPGQGYDVNLQKWVSGQWVKSVSGIKGGILGYFVTHQAMQQLAQGTATEPDEEDEQSDTEGTDKDETPAKPKKKVTG